jgi:hypothetical protein
MGLGDLKFGIIGFVVGFFIALLGTLTVILFPPSFIVYQLISDIVFYFIDLILGTKYRYVLGGPGIPSWTILLRLFIRYLITPAIFGWIFAKIAYSLGSRRASGRRMVPLGRKYSLLFGLLSLALIINLLGFAISWELLYGFKTAVVLLALYYIHNKNIRGSQIAMIYAAAMIFYDVVISFNYAALFFSVPFNLLIIYLGYCESRFLSND